MPYLKAKHLTANDKKINQQFEQNTCKLIYSGAKIRFYSEKDLEEYIESYFNKIFPYLVLVKRQYTIKNQRCDLLCCTQSSKQLVVIELKNDEDRGIVAQLTRYRKAILLEKPFADKIDYSLPVKLVAIAPTFHEDNYTDKEASKFENDIDFLHFSIENHKNLGKFKLCGRTYDIPYPIFGITEISNSSDSNNISLTVFTANFYGSLPLGYRNEFLSLRSLLLSQPKVKEMVNSSYRKILYGTGEGETHKKLAEITNTSKGIYLYLWLPTAVKTNIKIPVARFGLVLAKDNNPFAKDSVVEWVVCTKEAINIKEKSSSDQISSFNRQGMLKWSKANLYLGQATGIGVTDNTSRLLIYLLKGITPPIDENTLKWWKSYKLQTPDNLGWYIDLAIKTWNYRIK